MIETLIPDIYKYIAEGGWPDYETLSLEIAAKTQRPDNAGPARLRMSALGPVCPRALWYSVHAPERREPLPPWATIKLSYGHVIEAVAIALAKGAGHEVTGEQDEVILDGVIGHRDCVIDGCIVDVKSTASHMFDRLKSGKGLDQDKFLSGYLDQLDGYLVGSYADELVRDKERAYLLAVDKQLGHMVLHEHQARPQYIRNRIAQYKTIVEKDRPPVCECGTVPDGKSGNIRLDTKASYSPYKFSCWPNLRAFRYSDGLRYLTKVVRRPDVPEIDINGKIVYNV